MRFAQLAIRFFAAYNVFYSFAFFMSADVFLTSKGFLAEPLLGLSGDGELLFARMVLGARLIAALWTLTRPLSPQAWFAFFAVNVFVHFNAESFSLAFTPIFHTSLMLVFWGIALKENSRKLGSLALTYGFVSFQLLHFTSALSKLFNSEGAWRDGSALIKILDHSTWLREGASALPDIVGAPVLMLMTFAVMLVELSCGWLFSRKFSIGLCWALLAIHVGGLAFFSLEEVSLMGICNALVLIALARVETQADSTAAKQTSESPSGLPA